MSVFNASRLLGKTVLITGASSGIGAVRLGQHIWLGQLIIEAPQRQQRFCSQKQVCNPHRRLSPTNLAQAGSNLILTARRIDALEKVRQQCVAAHQGAGVQHGGQFVTILLDVSDKSQIASLLNKIPTDLRNIDILGKLQYRVASFSVSKALFSAVNNAGYVVGVDRVGDISLQNMEEMFATNVFGLIALTQLFIKGLLWFQTILLYSSSLKILEKGALVILLTSGPSPERSPTLVVVSTVQQSTLFMHSRQL